MTGRGFLLVWMTLLLADGSFAQESTKNSLDEALKKTAGQFRNDRPFHQAYLFFKARQWDSVLVCSMRQSGANAEVNNYCRLLRAISFREKKLLGQAKKTFLSIPETFQFYSVVMTNLGEIALEQNQYHEALRFFSDTEKQTNAYKSSSLYHNIGLCFFHLDQWDRAEPYLKKALLMQEKEKDSLLLAGSYMDIGNLYYQQYKDDLAIPYFEKAYGLSKKIKNFELRQNAALNMAVVEENRRNPLLALTYRKEYENWRDSLTDQNKVWAIAETEKKFIVGQKQKEIRLLQAQSKIRETQRNGLLFSSLLLLALFGAGVYFYRQKVKANRIILSQKTALDELNAAKDRLFSIVSHDLRSSVYALKASNGKLLENLGTRNYGALGKLLRDNSAIAGSTYSLLDNLLNWAMLQTKQSYFHPEPHRLRHIIEQAAYSYKPLMDGKNIAFENSVNSEIVVWADLDSVKIIFRNLLDNAVKFSKESGRISFYIRSVEPKYCEVVLEDTGNGMDELTRSAILNESFTGKARNGTGLGLQLCQSLIAKNDGQLAIESQPGAGTKIAILLPVNT